MLKSHNDEYETVWVDPDSIQEEIEEREAEEELINHYGKRAFKINESTRKKYETKIYDSVQEAREVVGNLWGSISPTIELTEKDLKKLLNGGVLPIDVLDEYVVFLKLKLVAGE